MPDEADRVRRGLVLVAALVLALALSVRWASRATHAQLAAPALKVR